MWFLRRRSGPALGPPSLETQLRLADLARDSGDAATAARHYEAVLAMSPDRLDVKVQLGNMLKDSGQLRQADAVYKDAQATAPDDPDICIQRGRVRKLMGDRAGALALFREAAGLSQDSFDAVEELSSLGASDAQQRRYEAHFRAGGSEAIMRMSQELRGMRALLDDMAERLPDALGQAAFPLDSYALLRELHTVPPPPPGARAALTALLLIDREAEPTLEAQLSGFAGQTARDWTLLAIGDHPARRAAVEQAAAGDPRIRLLPAAAGATTAAGAELQAARAVAAGWLLMLAQGAVPHPETLAWAARLPALAGADAYVFDEERGRLRDGRLEPLAPVFRAAVDYDTLLEANVVGETVLVGAETYRLLAPAPEGSVSRARSRLLLELARGGRIGHLAHPLVTRLDPVQASLPEHRLAIADHAAAHGFADRLAVAKGETGPSVWRPRTPAETIAVVIATEDNPHALRRLVSELREQAAAPDRVRIVLVDAGGSQPEMRATLEELGAKRFVTRATVSPPFSRAQYNSHGAQATDAPLLVFAHDGLRMMTAGWDEHVRGHLERETTGALGCRVLYADDTLCHAGILFGWQGRTINDGLFEPAEAAGPARRFAVTRAVGAVSDTFLAIRRDRFLAAGGFEGGTGGPAPYADVDLCLKLRREGLRILYTPAITVRTDAAKDAAMDSLVPARMGRLAAAQTWLHARWGNALAVDPGLNPIWYPATMPFRLLAAPSEPRVLRHLERTAATNPWMVEPTRGPGRS